MTHFKKALTLFALAASLTTQAQVQPITSVSAPVTTVSLVLPANTRVELEMVDAVSSKTNNPGDTFKLRVASPVAVGGIVLIPAGTAANGQVMHADERYPAPIPENRSAVRRQHATLSKHWEVQTSSALTSQFGEFTN